ncbi:hypothetical protein PPYR_00819 [Photinus pyralis]|uniref:Protein quiver n=1 Tax=Photinus pyralis TaxID=7054 RepID=A0A5N4B2L6_PHOPY|nr:uncharacterized protein LOC116159074 [Photinus pyralis]KAB0803849.1 hypothetical protein PPYR_00819 [Photinus pyralis]
MYFKLILASVALMCISVASGFTAITCYSCIGLSDKSPEELHKCRHFINITETNSQSPAGYCIFYVGIKRDSKATIAVRSSLPQDCEYHRMYRSANLHCSQCESNHCNTDKY